MKPSTEQSLNAIALMTQAVSWMIVIILPETVKPMALSWAVILFLAAGLHLLCADGYGKREP